MATLFLAANPQLLLHPSRLLSPNDADRKKIDKICSFLGNAEGRDKIAKIVQFFARFLDGFFREGPGAAILGPAAVPYCDQLKALWGALQTSRAWSWMGKSIVEWRTDIQTFENKTLSDEVKFLHMACRFFFAGRWFFENFMLLVQSKVLMDNTKGGFWAPAPELNKIAKRSWFIALCFGVATECAKLRLLRQKWTALEDVKSKKSTEAYEQEKSKLTEDLKLRGRTILMMLCDSPASISVGFGVPMSNMKIGFFMTIASYIQCKNLWPK